jgi:chemotaxis methyl-accepting protein methylase
LAGDQQGAAATLRPAFDLPGMDEDLFKRWVKLLEQRTGIVVPTTRRSFLVTNLRGRMREAGYSNFENYYQDLKEGPKANVEWATLVDRLTIHETRFFRHGPSYDFLGRSWLPERTASLSWDGSLHAWSVGCATGEEAYSLAMVLDQVLSIVPGRSYFGITATDVSQPALAVGRSGRYPISRRSEIPPDLAQRYVREVDSNSFEIDDKIRRRVAFSVFNLLDLGRAPVKELDLIFCQNVLIYFPRERRVEMLAGFARLLKPGAVMILGPGEVTQWTHPGLERVSNRQVLAYRRIEGAGS